MSPKSTPAPSSLPKKPAAPKEVDPNKLSAADAQKRCAAIYKLENTIEKKRRLHELAKAGAKAAKDSLKAAEDALAKEIQEQRFGPGPLFPVGDKDAK